jgi:hypothetical protein
MHRLPRAARREFLERKTQKQKKTKINKTRFKKGEDEPQRYCTKAKTMLFLGRRQPIMKVYKSNLYGDPIKGKW